MATYKIKSGDTLSRIAAQNGTTVAALAAANGISDPNKIRAGQSITIPAARTVAVPTQTAPKTSLTKKVIGQYNGKDIYAGNDAEIQAQMRTIDKGTTKPKSTLPAPDLGGIYSAVTQSNPVLADMLKDPAMKAQYDSLPPDLQGIFLQTANSLGKAIESGKVINPNIELTPAENAKLLKQAETELDPYYKEQLGILQDDFTTSVGRLMEDYGKATSREADKFKRTLDTNAETEAQQGTVYSSGRMDRETQTVTEEQQALDDAATTLERDATDKAKAFEEKAGSAALRSLNIPGLTTLKATNTGLTSGDSRQLYTGRGNIKLGTTQKDRTTAVGQRKNELEEAFRKNRLLDLTKLQ